MIAADKIHLVNIYLHQCVIDAEEAFHLHPKRPEIYELNIKSNLRFEFEQKRALVRLSFFINGLEKGGHPLGLSARFSIDFIFTIDNLDQFITKENDHVKVSDILGATLIGLGISTGRGMILEKTRGTFFDGFILPVFDPMQLLKNPEQLAPVSFVNEG